MYQKGDFVMKAHTGICQIKEISELDSPIDNSHKLYYTLIPLSDEKSKIFVPAEPAPDNLRKVISREEACSLLHIIPEIEPVYVFDEKQREQSYRKILRSNDPQKIAGIIKTIYMREQKRTAQGKKQTAMDKRYFQLAEEYLYSELALALGKDKADFVKNAKILKNK